VISMHAMRKAALEHADQPARLEAWLRLSMRIDLQSWWHGCT